MNQDDPKNSDTTESETSKSEGTSRRRFLTGGGAALAGVTAAVVSGRLEAAPPACAVPAQRGGILCDHNDLVPVKHHLDDPALVAVVVRAWNDYAYHAALLDDPEPALKLMGVRIPTGNTPVVLTQVQFEAEGHRIPSGLDQVLYVLPTPPVGGGLTGQAARDAMAAVPFGM